MGTPEAVGLPVTGLSEGSDCLYQQGQAVQEEYLTVTMKALQSFETSEATLKKIKRVTFQKT
jgi:hypothetical protein